jgi:glycerol uptake facilitator-like aquaporin
MPKGLLRELLAEFLGTFILIVFGVGVVAQVVLSKKLAGDFLSINIAWGLAVTMGCYVSAGVTGAHLNPAVTLALAVNGSCRGAGCCRTRSRRSPAPSSHRRWCT